MVANATTYPIIDKKYLPNTARTQTAQQVEDFTHREDAREASKLAFNMHTRCCRIQWMSGLPGDYERPSSYTLRMDSIRKKFVLFMSIVTNCCYASASKLHFMANFTQQQNFLPFLSELTGSTTVVKKVADIGRSVSQYEIDRKQFDMIFDYKINVSTGYREPLFRVHETIVQAVDNLGIKKDARLARLLVAIFFTKDIHLLSQTDAKIKRIVYSYVGGSHNKAENVHVKWGTGRTTSFVI